MTGPASASSSKPATDDAIFRRLHITPLDPELLDVVIPSSLRSSARNISYHTIQTFPERRYGFVELPVMDAEKLRKRVHGSVVKGAKVRIESARPPRQLSLGDEEEEAKNNKKKGKKEEVALDADATAPKKRKRGSDLVDGVLLNDRKVKRGWTQPADGKTKDKRTKHGTKERKRGGTKSKFTDKEECLLKTKVPPNAMSTVTASQESAKRNRKKGKDKDKARTVTVHEFEKASKFPSFLKNSNATTSNPTEFVEGQGWVDEDGNVVEPVKDKEGGSAAHRAKTVTKHSRADEGDDESDDGTSSSETSSSSCSSDAREQPVASPRQAPGKDAAKADLPTTPLPFTKAEDPRAMSTSSSHSLTIKVPSTGTAAAGVHPLEALYKRHRTDNTGEGTPNQEPKPFSFFGAGDGDDDGHEDAEADPSQTSTTMPMTPFTRQDFEWRNVRSAAPTPDTAHPSRSQNFWPWRDGDEPTGEHGGLPVPEGSEGDGNDKAGAVSQKQQQQQQQQQQKHDGSEFQSWFWQNRRDLTRSWMNRRKAAAKEKRHRDNKARASNAT